MNSGAYACQGLTEIMGEDKNSRNIYQIVDIFKIIVYKIGSDYEISEQIVDTFLRSNIP
jgi:hypothetical protein